MEGPLLEHRQRAFGPLPPGLLRRHDRTRVRGNAAAQPTPICWSARTRSSAASIPRRRSFSAASAGNTPDGEINLYYREALLELAARSADGFFDFFDYHDFNIFTKYQQSSQGRTVEFFRTLLNDTGFAGKPILVKAGGTHSGMDLASSDRRLRQLQTESSKPSTRQALRASRRQRREASRCGGRSARTRPARKTSRISFVRTASSTTASPARPPATMRSSPRVPILGTA